MSFKKPKKRAFKPGNKFKDPNYKKKQSRKNDRFNDRFERNDRPRFDKKDFKKLVETKQPGLYTYMRNYYTKNPKPGKLFFDMERERKIEGSSYREVDPNRSKFVAAIAKGLQQTGIVDDSVVLYLGASHGYTPSFFSDFIPNGLLFCLDFAPRVVRDLYFVCEERENMAPIMASAADISAYEKLVPEVDAVFQDIAQRDQVGIFLKNCDHFLKKGGHGLLAVKARSIDVTAKPKDVFKKIRQDFEENKDYVIIDYRELDPFEKDHAFFVIRKK